MWRSRRAAFAGTILALNLALGSAQTLVNAPLEPAEGDDPNFDPLKLPFCTEEQLKLRNGTSECFFKSYSRTEGLGVCPENCCCDLKTSVASNSTTYTFGAVGSCSSRFIWDANENVVALWMLPFSVVGTKARCSQTTGDVCGSLGIGPQGCQLKPAARASPSASPLPANSGNSDASDAVKRDGDDGSSSSRTRNIVLGSVAACTLLVAIAAATAYFIVRPWLQNELSSHGDHFEEEFDAEVANSDGTEEIQFGTQP